MDNAKTSIPRFLQKLQLLVKESPEHMGGWNDQGTEFEVRDPSFAEIHLPKYFKGNTSTFVRQLHFYGFKKHDRKKDRWTFSHPKFLRDDPDMLYDIKRKTRSDFPGPASKQDFTSLRREIDTMRKSIANLEQQFQMFQNELLRMRPPTVSSSSSSSVPPSLNSYNKRSFGEMRNSSGSLSKMAALPFEDESAGIFPIDHHDPESEPEEDLKKRKVENVLDFGNNFEFDDDFADIFVGLPIHDDQNITGLDIPQVDDEDLVSVRLLSRTHQIPLSNEMFAGFLSNFVECTLLLHRKKLLHKEVDAAMEVYIHNNLPREHPLRQLMLYANPEVRNVLVNALNHAGSFVHMMKWEAGSRMDQGDMPDDSFSNRPIISFETENALTEVTGAKFLQFLNFLLQSAVNDNPNEPFIPQQQTSPFFLAFEKYFSPDVRRIMTRAKHNLEEFKRTIGDVSQCYPAREVGHRPATTSSRKL